MATSEKEDIQMSKTQVSEFLKDPESLRLFHQEKIILDVTERMCEALENTRMNRVQLAGALRKTKGYISQLLDGSANMTLRTMSDVFLALGLVAQIKTQPLNPCRPGRLALVHDEETSVRNWRPHWRNRMATDAPNSDRETVYETGECAA